MPPKAKTPRLTAREQQLEFMETLAAAITQWQPVEMSLFGVFSALLGPAHYAIASAAFHAIINFNTRLAVVDAAAHVALAGKPELAEWTTLHNRMNKRSKKRNELVHFMILWQDGEEGEETPIALLRPSIFDINADPNRAYDVKQIGEIRASFGVLAHDLGQFAGRLRIAPAPSPDKSP